jgi:hypothetical protein
MKPGLFPTALILRSSLQAASRRMLQEARETSGASFETPLTRLLRMRAEVGIADIRRKPFA